MEFNGQSGIVYILECLPISSHDLFPLNLIPSQFPLDRILTGTAGISLYRDCLYGNLYVMPIYGVHNCV